MKRITAIAWLVFALTTSGTMLTGCKNKTASNKYKLMVSTVLTANDPITEGLNRFAETVAKNTNNATESKIK